MSGPFKGTQSDGGPEGPDLSKSRAATRNRIGWMPLLSVDTQPGRKEGG